jgi:hypothetical protein
MLIKAPRVRELEYKKDGATYQSYQVIWKDHEGRRQRKQFADHNEAALFSSEKHTELLNRGSSHRNVSTILSEPDIRAAESCITRLGGKYKLAEAVDFFLKHFHEPDFKITVSEASVKFRASLEGRVRDRTLVQMGYSLRHFEEFSKNYFLHEITPEDVVRFLQSLRARDGVNAASKKTWNNYRTDLYQFFGWCGDKPRRWISGNPAADATRFKIDREQINVLALDQCKALMNYVAEFRGGELVRYFALALFAGIRPDGELRKLAQHSELADLGNRVIRITPMIAKTRKARQVQIRPNLHKWLTRYPAEILPSNWKPDVARIRERFGLNVALNHDVLRHTFISMHIGAFKSFADAAIESGNSEQIIKDSYLNTSSLSQAKAFWKIGPK